MGNEMFQARLNDDFAEEVNQYREEKHMSKSETVRQGLRLLIEDSNGGDGDRESDTEAPEIVTDGGGGALLRPILKFVVSFYLSFGLFLFAVLYAAVVQLGADVPARTLMGMMLSAFTLGAVFFIPLLTTIPERIDRALWAFSSMIRGRLPA